MLLVAEGNCEYFLLLLAMI